MKNQIFLTFDIDWAENAAFIDLLELCEHYGVKATFNLTHHTKIIGKIRENSAFYEAAIHPNFLSGSNHGTNEEEVLQYCKNLVPDALSVRTHCVYQHGKLFSKINELFSSTMVDSSVGMQGIPNIPVFRDYNEAGCMIRIPHIWSDDYYLLGKEKINPLPLLDVEGCKVFLFHPVHIFYNSVDLEHYAAIKNGNSAKCIEYKGKKGIRDLFIALLKKISSHHETGLMKEFLGYDFG